MAEETGGRYALTPASYESVLRDVLADNQNYYSLGYTAERIPEGATRNIRVKVGDGAWRVRFRRRLRDKTTVERAADQTRAALLFEPRDNPLGIAIEAETPAAQDDDRFVVPLRVLVPLDRLVLLPGATEHRAKVSIFVAAKDHKGRSSEVKQHICPIRIANSQILTARGQTAACGVRLLMRRGPQRVAVSVLDELAAIDSTIHLELHVGAEDPAATSDSERSAQGATRP